MNTILLKSTNHMLNKKFFKYVIPSVTSMWISALFVMVDAMFVSKGVGPEALAAVNIAMPFTNLVFGLSILFSMGASTVISMTMGEGNDKLAKRYFTMTLATLAIISIFLFIFSFIFLDDIAIFLGGTSTTLPMVKSYLKIIVTFIFFYILSYALEVLIKTDGFPHLSIIGAIISALTNIVLDYIFVIKLDYGVEGAAVATGLARVFSFTFFLCHFLGKKSSLKFTKFKFEFNFIKRITSIGFSDCITELSVGIVILLFNQFILNYLGGSALVSYSVIAYINTLVLATMLGISQGLQPLCSYYYGTKDNYTIKYLLTLSLKVVTLCSLTIFLVCIFLTDYIVLLFIDMSDMELFNYTKQTFKIFSISFLLLGFNVIISGFLASLEKAAYACKVSLGRGLFIVSISLIFMSMIFGGNGIWYSTIVSEAIVLIFAIFILRKVHKNLDLEIDLTNEDSLKAV